jgi:hypothetical protein
MREPSTECRLVRESLLETAISGSAALVRATQETAAHLSGCADCRRYRNGLRAAPHLFRDECLYTPSARARAMAAVTAASEEGAPRLLPLFVSAIALTAVLASLIPVWLLARILSPLVESPALSLGVAITLTHVLGGAAAGLSTAPLAARLLRDRGVNST